MTEHRQDSNLAKSCGASGSPRPAARHAAPLAPNAAIVAMAALASLLAAVPAPAGVNFWTSLGPNGGGIAALLPDSFDPQVVYAASRSGGVFKSADGGTSWQAASRGLTQLQMVALAADPLAPGTLYAAGNSLRNGSSVFVSHDGAATWTPAAPFGLTDSVWSLAADPAHAGTVYAGGLGDVWVSHDSGRSWTLELNGEGVETVLVAADPARSSVFAFVAFPATFFETISYSLFETADGGVTWNDRSASLPDLPVGYVEVSFAIEPAAPGVLYLAMTRTEVDTGRLIPKTFRSVDGGTTWQRVGTGGYPLAVDAGGLVVSGGQRSADHGVTWVPITAPPDSFQGYAVAAGGARIYAAGDVLGVLASSDGGRRWQVASQGIAATSVMAFAADPQAAGTLYAAAAGLGLMKTRNSGKRWRLLDTGFSPPFVTCCSPEFPTLAADPAVPGTLFYVVGLGALDRSTDGGASWTALPQDSVVSLVPDPSSPAVLYAVRDATCWLSKSTDQGAHWSCLGVYAYEVVVAPSAPATLYALVAYPAGHVLYKSTDAGASWAPIDRGLPLASELSNSARGHLAVDPGNASRLWVSGPSGIWATQDGGAHWSKTSHGLPSSSSAPPLLATDHASPPVLYAADGAFGVYRSRDGGSHWQPIIAGLPPLSSVSYTALAADPARPGSLYLATLGNGVFGYTSR